jgi:hypothetical protein
MPYNLVVAVDEGYNLPAEVILALATSETIAEAIRDVINASLSAGSHVNLSVVSDDALDSISITVADATTSTKGVVQLTNHLGGTAAAPTVRSATTSLTGISELATNAETITGTDAARVVTPAGLTAVRGLYVAVNAQTGTTYAPVLADQGKVVTLSNAAAITVTLPSDATTAFPIGTEIVFVTTGAGTATFAAGASAAVTGVALTASQWTVTTVIKTAANTWVVSPVAAGGGGGAASWGTITGTLSSQTDLQTALNAKVTAFADPNADRIMFWDDSAGAFAPLSVSSAFSISGTTMGLITGSTGSAGILQLATNSEVVTGTDSTKAVTSAGVTATRGLYVAVNAQTGTTYAPVLADQGKVVTLSNAAAITVTLPSDATTAFPIGTEIIFVTLGAGTATFAAGASATVTGVALTASQWTVTRVIKTAANTWVVSPVAAGGGGGGASWGTITGTLSSQTDLQTALNAKVTAFADPNGDRIMFWDDSAGAFAPLSVSTVFSISGTTMGLVTGSVASAGILQLASSSDVVTGTDTTKAATSAGVTATRGLYVGVNPQTGTTYAPVLTDQGKLVTLSNTAAITVTLPSDATVAFPIGTQIDFSIINTGLATFVAGSGATVNGTPSLVARAQWSSMTAVKYAANSWILIGDLA